MKDSGMPILAVIQLIRGGSRDVERQDWVMSTENRTFPPSPEFSKKAHIKALRSMRKSTRGRWKTPKLLGEMAEKQLTCTKMGQGTWLDIWRQARNKVVRRWQIERLIQLPWPFYQGPTRNKAALIWESDAETQDLYVSATLCRGQQVRQCHEEKGLKKETGSQLSAHDPGARYFDARLHEARCNPCIVSAVLAHRHWRTGYRTQGQRWS